MCGNVGVTNSVGQLCGRADWLHNLLSAAQNRVQWLILESFAETHSFWVGLIVKLAIRKLVDISGWHGCLCEHTLPSESGFSILIVQGRVSWPGRLLLATVPKGTPYMYNLLASQQ